MGAITIKYNHKNKIKSKFKIKDIVYLKSDKNTKYKIIDKYKKENDVLYILDSIDFLFNCGYSNNKRGFNNL